jgi:hypothetical protein
MFALVTTQADAKPKGPKDAPDSASDDATQQARDAFRQGIAALKATQFAEALTHFQRANSLKPSPSVTFNIGYCHRALGHYLLARNFFEDALRNPDALPDPQREEARTLLEDIDTRVLAHITIKLDPASAKIAIDGRPLRVMPGSANLLMAGVAPAGEGEAPPSAVFEVLIDPGVHLIQASRPGNADVLLNRTFAPSAREQLELKLDELPATIHVDSDQSRAVVTIDDHDVGMTPIEVPRPAGRYRLQVQKKGFVTYSATIDLGAGQKTNITARLNAEREPITKTWWFWTGAAAIIAGGATATYFLTRPDSSPPPYNGGSLGWVAQPR